MILASVLSFRMRLDHIVWGVPDLTKAIESIEEKMEIKAAKGGIHPGFGTKNALIGLGRHAYLEILGPDPLQVKDQVHQSWMGIDEVSFPRIVRWAIQTHSIDESRDLFLNRYLPCGPVMPGERRLAGGALLSWKLTDPDSSGDCVIPFLIEWGKSAHPSAGLDHDCTLRSFKMEYKRPDQIEFLNEAFGPEQCDISEGPSRISIVLETVAGLFFISSDGAFQKV